MISELNELVYNSTELIEIDKLFRIQKFRTKPSYSLVDKKREECSAFYFNFTYCFTVRIVIDPIDVVAGPGIHRVITDFHPVLSVRLQAPLTAKFSCI